MNFKGAAKRLTDYDIPRIGHMIGVGEDEVHAVLDVESRGSGFDKQGRPTALYEPHIAYKYSSGALRDLLVKEGLAYPRWGQAKYPADSYDRIERAYKIDPRVALLSTSWGLGQVMGFNHKAAGYSTPQAMVKAFMESEANQLEGMINFIIANKLDDEIRRHDWAGFALGYNGEGYKKNKYDTRLAAAFKRWQGIKDTPWSPTMAVIETLENDPVAPHAVSLEPVAEPYVVVVGSGGGGGGGGKAVVLDQETKAPTTVAPAVVVQPSPRQADVPPSPSPVVGTRSFFGWLASLFKG